MMARDRESHAVVEWLESEISQLKRSLDIREHLIMLASDRSIILIQTERIVDQCRAIEEDLESLKNVGRYHLLLSHEARRIRKQGREMSKHFHDMLLDYGFSFNDEGDMVVPLLA